jgi:hypothetical protein
MSCFRGNDSADYAGWTLTAIIAGLIMEPVAGETMPGTLTKGASTMHKKVIASTAVEDSGLWE